MRRVYKKQQNSDDAVDQIIAEMRYLERIGRNPFCPSLPLPKPQKHRKTLYKREKVKDCLGRVIKNVPF